MKSTPVSEKPSVHIGERERWMTEDAIAPAIKSMRSSMQDRSHEVYYLPLLPSRLRGAAQCSKQEETYLTSVAARRLQM